MNYYLPQRWYHVSIKYGQRVDLSRLVGHVQTRPLRLVRVENPTDSRDSGRVSATPRQGVNLEVQS